MDIHNEEHLPGCCDALHRVLHALQEELRIGHPFHDSVITELLGLILPKPSVISAPFKIITGRTAVPSVLWHPKMVCVTPVSADCCQETLCLCNVSGWFYSKCDTSFI
jgi:hypothetical protein